jgi:uncharacterized protein (TIGR02145 family)
MGKQFLLCTLILVLVCELPAQQYGSLKDSRDGRVYKTVKIGDQVWMAENLNVSTFNNGDPIPHAKTNEEWIRAGENKQPAWCYYNNDPIKGNKYGKLYNWYAVSDARGLAPVGYHLPTRVELETLEDFLGRDEASNKMRSKSGWNSFTIKGTKVNIALVGEEDKFLITPTKTYSGNGSNISGFNAFPIGYRNEKGQFEGVGEVFKWWIADFTVYTNNGPPDVKCAWLESGEYSFFITSWPTDTKDGHSVRCIKNK